MKTQMAILFFSFFALGIALFGMHRINQTAAKAAQIQQQAETLRVEADRLNREGAELETRVKVMRDELESCQKEVRECSIPRR